VKRTPLPAILLLAVPLPAVLLLAGCATSTEQAAPVPVPANSRSDRPAVSRTPTPAVTRGGVCLVGAWTSTGFDISAGKVHESGGAGVRMTIGSTGAGKVVYDGMKPLRLTGQVTGTVTFHGSASGAVRLPAAGVAEGKWVTTRTGDVSGLTADVSITSPAKMSMQHLAVGKLAKSMAGASAPQLTSGTWRCSADTLVSTAPAGGSWTLTRDH
jgi:hypothetical protein